MAEVETPPAPSPTPPPTDTPAPIKIFISGNSGNKVVSQSQQAWIEVCSTILGSF